MRVTIQPSSSEHCTFESNDPPRPETPVMASHLPVERVLAPTLGDCAPECFQSSHSQRHSLTPMRADGIGQRNRTSHPLPAYPPESHSERLSSQPLARTPITAKTALASRTGPKNQGSFTPRTPPIPTIATNPRPTQPSPDAHENQCTQSQHETV